MTSEELIKRCRAAGINIPPSGMVRAAMVKNILDVSNRTLEVWRQEGKPPRARKLNGSWFYDVADLAAFLE